MNTSYQNILPLFSEIMPFGGKINLKNRWIRLSELVPWEELEERYVMYFDWKHRNRIKNCRLMTGLMIGKHLMSLSDEGVVEYLHENPYFQYFCGFESFVSDCEGSAVDPSLLSKRRKRLGKEYFKKFEGEIINVLQERGLIKGKKVMLDATVIPGNISYPNDVKVMNQARKWLCQTILKVKNALNPKIKIRTYRRKAEQLYVSFQRTKKKTKARIKKTKKAMLGYLRRNIRQLESLVVEYEEPFCWKSKELKYYVVSEVKKKLKVAKRIYEQQREMIEKKTNRVKERIVSFYEPKIRPIVRGKEGKSVEFGPKIHVANVEGYALVDKVSYESFHEGKELKRSLELHEKRFGRKPEKVYADEIYGTRENRSYLKSEEIEECFRPVGRVAEEVRKVKKKERKKRNQIEGLIGTLKESWELNKIRYKINGGADVQISLAMGTHNLKRALRMIEA